MFTGVYVQCTLGVGGLIMLSDRIYEFFKLLFDEGDGVCFGDYKATKVSSEFPVESCEFFCINALDTAKDYGHLLKDYYREDKSRRADINVTKYRSFLFEFDSVPLEVQSKILESCGINFTRLSILEVSHITPF